MNSITYADYLNQIQIKDDNENYLDEKIKKVSDIFNDNYNIYIYSIYNKLIEIDESLKTDNIETIIFIIFVLIKENKIESKKIMSKLFIKYSDKFLILHNNDFLILSILFYSYMEKIINCDIYNILENLK